MARFTITDLRNTIDELNNQLSTAGVLLRLEEGGRNGYQAVDEYSVDSQGERVNSGVNLNVSCGTSRECASESRHHVANILLAHYKEIAESVKG